MRLDENRKSRLEYKWVIVAVSFVMVFTTLGFCSGNRSLYLKSITSALNIPRSLFSISESCRFITTAVLNLFFGTLIMRLGTKKLIACGFASLIISCLIYSWGTSVWAFYVGGCFLGMGLAWCTTTVVGYVVSKWFKKNRGTVMGIILAANGLGTAVSSQIVSPIIHDPTNIFGYRNAYRLSALILFVVAVITMIFYKEAPKDYVEDSKVKPSAAKKRPARGVAWDGIPFTEVKKKYYFYAAAVCMFFTGSALQAANGVASAHLEDVGLDTTFIATALSIHSLMLAGAKILSGAGYDHFGLRPTVLICDAFGAISIFMLACVGSTSYTLATLYEILISFAMPLETIMLPLIAADMFGDRAYPKVMGLFVSICTAGFAVSAPLTNLVYDLTGTYRSVLFFLAAIMAVVTVVFQLILRSAGRDRKAIIAECERKKQAEIAAANADV